MPCSVKGLLYKAGKLLKKEGRDATREARILLGHLTKKDKLWLMTHEDEVIHDDKAFYDLVQPDFEIRCTRVIYRRGLAYLSKKYKIPLNHHDALSDAHACAQLYLMHLKRQNLPRTGTLF